MKFEDTELETTFELPDQPTLRVLSRYDSAFAFGSGDASRLYERLWGCVCAVAEDWHSAHVELKQTALDEVAGRRSMDVIKWAALSVFSWRQHIDAQLEDAIKNE